jgi:uncharacterized membrane protein
MNIKKLVKKILEYSKSLFFNGLLIILPVTLTVWLFTFSIGKIAEWLKPLRELLPVCLLKVPHAELALALSFVFIIGAIFKIFVLDPVIHAIERSIVLRIPLVSPIYTGIKQLVSALTAQEKKISFNTVVLIEFPRTGVYSIGFLTGHVPAELAPHAHEEFHTIFIPTTPNPTSGYLIIASHSQYRVVDLTRQEAMALIISGGIVQPNRFK